MNMHAPVSLYDRIGGNEALKQAVQKMYIRILTDPELSPFFPADKIEKLKSSQVAFLTLAFGGPHQYTGKSLREAHAPLVAQGLTDRHFDAVAYHLGKALEEMAVAPEIMSEVLDLVESTRNDVLNR